MLRLLKEEAGLSFDKNNIRSMDIMHLASESLSPLLFYLLYKVINLWVKIRGMDFKGIGA